MMEVMARIPLTAAYHESALARIVDFRHRRSEFRRWISGWMGGDARLLSEYNYRGMDSNGVLYYYCNDDLLSATDQNHKIHIRHSIPDMYRDRDADNKLLYCHGDVDFNIRRNINHIIRKHNQYHYYDYDYDN